MKIHKLNATGVAHHFLIALVAVTLVASFGAYRVFFSKASTNSAFSYAGVDETALFDTNTEGGCWLAGRKWQPAHTAKVKNKAGKVVKDKKGNAKTKQVPAGCSKTCRYGDGKDIASTAKGVRYCKKAIDLIEPAKCVNEYHRRFVSEVGCAKRVADVSLNNSAHCNSPNNNYVREEGVSSNCVAETVEVPAGKAKSQEQVSQETTPTGEPVQSKPPKKLKEAKKKKKGALTRVAETVTGGGKKPAPVGVSESFCKSLGRKYDGKGGCRRKCLDGYGSLTNRNGSQWDKCLKGADPCLHYMWCESGKSGGGAVTKKEKEAAKKAADAEKAREEKEIKVKKELARFKSECGALGLKVYGSGQNLACSGSYTSASSCKSRGLQYTALSTGRAACKPNL